MSGAPRPAPPPTTIGVDLGGTKTTAGLVRHGDEIAVDLTVPTPARDGADAVVATVVDLVERIRGWALEHNAGAPTGVGIGSAGVIDPGTGDVLAATDHIPGWAGTALGRSVAAATGLPVRVLNDVHAHALGEARHGAGRGLRSVLVVAAGTGLGGAFVLEGSPLTGAHHAAGHLGHVPAPEADGLTCSCGRAGHLESVASGPGLVQLFRRRGGDADDARAVVAAARGGHVLATECVTLSGGALGRAIGGWINLLDPDAVVVTGGLVGSGDLWWHALQDAAAAELVHDALRCPVLRARRGPQAAILGAASLLESP